MVKKSITQMFPLICKRKEINRKDSTKAHGPHEAISPAARTNHIAVFPKFFLLGHPEKRKPSYRRHVPSMQQSG